MSDPPPSLVISTRVMIAATMLLKGRVSSLLIRNARAYKIPRLMRTTKPILVLTPKFKLEITTAGKIASAKSVKMFQAMNINDTIPNP